MFRNNIFGLVTQTNMTIIIIQKNHTSFRLFSSLAAVTTEIVAAYSNFLILGFMLSTLSLS